MRISVFLVMVHMVIGDGEVQGGCGREVGCGRVENEKPIVRTRQAGASGSLQQISASHGNSIFRLGLFYFRIICCEDSLVSTDFLCWRMLFFTSSVSKQCFYY